MNWSGRAVRQLKGLVAALLAGMQQAFLRIAMTRAYTLNIG